MSCVDCVYFWKDEYEEMNDNGEVVWIQEKHGYCHWESRCPGDVPPCEEEGW